jgi:aspartate 1-decarboxylase
MLPAMVSNAGIGGAMQLTLLKTKIHRATVTETELGYEGSLSIDKNLMEASGILPYEQIDVLNINNGHRFTTYAIESAPGSGDIKVNGAAARLAQRGDLVIICAFAAMEEDVAKQYHPTIVHVDTNNKVVNG